MRSPMHKHTQTYGRPSVRPRSRPESINGKDKIFDPTQADTEDRRINPCATKLDSNAASSQSAASSTSPAAVPAAEAPAVHAAGVVEPEHKAPRLQAFRSHGRLQAVDAFNICTFRCLNVDRCRNVNTWHTQTRADPGSSL